MTRTQLDWMVIYLICTKLTNLICQNFLSVQVMQYRHDHMLFTIWRRKRDSNPRIPFWEITFLAGRRFRPTQPFLQRIHEGCKQKTFSRKSYIFYFCVKNASFYLHLYVFYKKLLISCLQKYISRFWYRTSVYILLKILAQHSRNVYCMLCMTY